MAYLSCDLEQRHAAAGSVRPALHRGLVDFPNSKGHTALR